jgi:flagellar hook-basal body complex protein FliE
LRFGMKKAKEDKESDARKQRIQKAINEIDEAAKAYDALMKIRKKLESAYKEILKENEEA